jgi:hypothetical protein
MYKTIGAAFGLAAIAFGGAGDPIVAALAVVCGLVWIGATPVFRPRFGTLKAERTQDMGLD